MALARGKAIQLVESKIVPFSESQKYVKVCLYGPNGAGKTRTAAQSPSPILLDVNEKGTSSVRKFPGEVFHANKWEDITYFYWYLRHGKHTHQTLIIDTATQMQKMCMKHILKEAEDRDPNRPPSMPRRQDWGQMAEMISEKILWFRNLPMHVVFVAQRRQDTVEDEDEETVETRWVPNLSPAPRDTLLSSVGITAYVHQRPIKVVKKEGKKRNTETRWVTCALVGPSANHETKDRTGELGRVLIKPTIHKMIEANNNTEEE